MHVFIIKDPQIEDESQAYKFFHVRTEDLVRFLLQYEDQIIVSGESLQEALEAFGAYQKRQAGH